MYNLKRSKYLIGDLIMGEIKKVLTEIKQLIIETEDILKNKFDCDDYIKNK